MNQNWHTLEINEIIKNLNTTPNGISDQEANSRLKKYGLNKLSTKRKKILFKDY